MTTTLSNSTAGRGPRSTPTMSSSPDHAADLDEPTAPARRRAPVPESVGRGARRARGEEPSERGHDRPRSSRLPWVLAAIGLIGTVGFGLLWLGARGDSPSSAPSDSSAEMLASARSFSKALTNFDGQSIDRDFDAITAQAAGEFRTQADQFFSSDVRAQLKETQASSRGEIRSAFVQSLDGDRGTVFVVVDQTIANNLSPQPQADTLRMELGLIERNGTWKVQRVAVLTAPSGGSTAAGAASAKGGSGN